MNYPGEFLNESLGSDDRLCSNAGSGTLVLAND